MTRKHRAAMHVKARRKAKGHHGMWRQWRGVYDAFGHYWNWS
jgi:hypothetical protein